MQFELALDDSAMPNSFSWMWNGVAQSTLSNVSGFGYTLFTGLVTATSTTATLKFDFTDPQSFWLLDDVSVNVVAVPEPPTFALLALGILVAGLKRALRRSARKPEGSTNDLRRLDMYRNRTFAGCAGAALLSGPHRQVRWRRPRSTCCRTAPT